MARPLPESFERILICQLRQIGDVVLATPAVSMLAKAYPGAEIHFLTEAKCAPVLENNPDIHKVWALDKAELGGVPGQMAYYRKVASQGFDLVVDFQQLPRLRWVVLFSRAKVRLTFSPPWYNRWLYTHHARQIDGYSAMSRASLLRVLGLQYQGERPRIHLTDAEKARGRELLAEMGLPAGARVVTVDPSHRRDTRRWPADSFARLLELATEKQADLAFVILHGPGELANAEAVAKGATRARAVVPKNILGLRDLAAIIAAADMHLGTCSAPRHFAVAVGTPSLTVLGSTSSAWTFPAPEHRHVAMNLDCQPCNDNVCSLGDNRCLTALAPDSVLPEFLSLLGAKTNAAS